MKTTPIDELEDLADGVPVLAVEGTVKFAQELKRGKSAAGHDWTKQFFVLASDNAEIACSMWDAEGSELAKGETVHIENTQNKKGAWTGITKGSYSKDGVRKHTLEIRANQIKITQSNKTPMHDTSTQEAEEQLNRRLPNPDHAKADTVGGMFRASVAKANGGDGVTEARKHIMQSANLYVLCVAAVESYCAGHFPQIAQTSEMFQAATGTLFIEASRAGLVAKMPTTPVHKDRGSTTAQRATKEDETPF